MASRRRSTSYRLTKRGGIGVINMKTTEKTGKVVAAFPVEEDSEIMIITQQAKLIRLGVDKIRETGRSRPRRDADPNRRRRPRNKRIAAADSCGRRGINSSETNGRR